MKPSLLLLDEPTANLDKFSERTIVEILKALSGHCTVITVSHSPIFDNESVQILNLEEQLIASRPAAARSL